MLGFASGSCPWYFLANRYERDSGLGSWKLVGEYVLKRQERGESTERDLRSEAQLSKEGSKKA